jgi:hypothetical protein
LSVILDDTTLLCQIHENLKDPLVISIQGQLTNHQVQYFSNDHVKFEFQDGMLLKLSTMLSLQAILNLTRPWS